MDNLCSCTTQEQTLFLSCTSMWCCLLYDFPRVNFTTRPKRIVYFCLFIFLSLGNRVYLQHMPFAFHHSLCSVINAEGNIVNRHSKPSTSFEWLLPFTWILNGRACSSLSTLKYYKLTKRFAVIPSGFPFILSNFYLSTLFPFLIFRNGKEALNSHFFDLAVVALRER